jgi:steroid delta-isomerase
MDTTPSSDLIRSVIARYAHCLSNGDIEGLAALFAPGATFEDPIGTPPVIGPEGARQFFSAALQQTGGRILFEPEGAVRIRGEHAACAFVATCDRIEPPFVTETLDIFRFDAQGRILSLVAIWGETNARPL